MDMPVQVTPPIALAEPQRHKTRQARIAWDGTVVTVGGDAPVRIQSIIKSDTRDAEATAWQVKESASSGSELVRITVNTPEAAAQAPSIRERLDQAGCSVPLIGDFHHDGRKQLTQFPACAEALSRYRINRGTGEAPAAPVYVDGRHTVSLRGDPIADGFHAGLGRFIGQCFGRWAATAA